MRSLDNVMRRVKDQLRELSRSMSDLESITNNELEDCRKEIERLTGNNIALENELEECEEQLKECKDELKNCQKEIEYLRGGNGIG